MMRLAAYAGTSMVLATGVIIRALHERANFYSACVYLAQSNACLMVLTNVALLGVCTGMLGLQKLFYGPLRPIEVEQLYEKAWFAITETCLAMTIFREEVGGWFLVMFVCLLVGKVWGWIGEGRVEVLEQQPPSNLRLFHARLSISLIISTLFDVFMLRYSILTVLRHARPNMMVMFAFEFAVLTVTSLSTAARYTISLHEASIIRIQIQERQALVMQERETSRAQTDAADSAATADAARSGLDPGDEFDLLDIDVPGWEEKSRWVFYLDLSTDFLKLILYLTFFCVLCIFYGMPIHIIRDVALTIRSFYKRIADFVRYRQATKDMNARYPDATAEEVAREDVCIICREDMRPWRQQNVADGAQVHNAVANVATPAAVDERLRPKKLPCGHILHFACLRSWLERQQICPTCRRPVLVAGTTARAQERRQANQDVRNHVHPNHPQAQAPAHEVPRQPVAAQNVFNLGPLRIAFGARQGIPGPQQQININPPSPAHQDHLPNPGQLPRLSNPFGSQHQALGLHNRTVTESNSTNLQVQLILIEQQLNREISGLRLQQSQLHLVRALQGELARLRIAQATPEMPFNSPPFRASQSRMPEPTPQTVQVGHTYVSTAQQQSIGNGNTNLPTGMTVPPGWTVLPLQRLPDEPSCNSTEAASAISSGSQLQMRAETPSTGSPVNDANTPQASGAISSSTAANESSITRSHLHQDPAANAIINDEVQPVPLKRGSAVQSPAPSPGELGRIGNSELRASSSGDERASSHPSIDSGQLKGKGKVSTVEESFEDTD